MTTSTDEIAKFLRRAMAERRKALVNALRYLGELCINEARDSGTYTDRTGNLRASLGYVVLKDGKTLGSPKLIRGGTQDGKARGEETIRQAISETNDEGYVLIVVAGMHYAKYVEAMGYNVLTSAQLLAERQAPIILNQLRLKWRKG